MKKFIKEFKEFAFRGNMFDMAIGVMIGGAIAKIVASIVDDMIMPLIGLLTGGFDLTGLSVTVGDATVAYGNFLNAVLDFIIMALCIFLVLKLIMGIKTKKPEEPAKEPRLCPHCFGEVNDKATRCPHCTSELDAPKDSEAA